MQNKSPPVPTLRNEQRNSYSPPVSTRRLNTDIRNNDDDEIPSKSEIQPLKLSRSQTFHEDRINQQEDIPTSQQLASRNNSISGNIPTVTNNPKHYSRTVEETKDVIAQLELMRQQLKLEQAKVKYFYH